MLPFFPGIRRPALLALLPTEMGSVAIIDVGGMYLAKLTIWSSLRRWEWLFNAATSAWRRPPWTTQYRGRVKKGTREVQQAYQILKEKADCGSPLQFVGNVEGRDVFQGKVDLLVTDGFTGNVMLKTSEGVAGFILDTVKKTLGPSHDHHLEHMFQQLQQRFNYAEHPEPFYSVLRGSS